MIVMAMSVSKEGRRLCVRCKGAGYANVCGSDACLCSVEYTRLLRGPLGVSVRRRPKPGEMQEEERSSVLVVGFASQGVVCGVDVNGTK